MPTARPSITARVSEVSVRSVKPLASVMPEGAERDAEDAGEQRQAGGQQRPEGHGQHDQRDHDTEDLADRLLRLHRGGDPAVLDRMPACLAAVGGRRDGVGLGGRDLLRRRR